MIIGYEAGVSGLSCKGDSGGPLVVFDSETGLHSQVGIVSGGSCGNTQLPSVFTRIENPDVLQFIKTYSEILIAEPHKNAR